MTTTTPTFPPVVFSVTDAAISELEAKHRGLVVAHGDKKGYLALTQAIAEIRTARTSVEDRRVELKKDALEYGRLVDSTAKEITARLLAIETPLKQNKEQYDAEVERIKREKEEAEKARIAGIQAKIAGFSNATALLTMAPADRLRQAIEKAQAMEITEAEYAEFVDQANEAKASAIAALQDLLTARIASDEAEAERKAEAERIAAEQAALAAERAEFQRQQAEARRIQEEADRARREAEAAEQAKRDAEQAAQQAALAAERAELKRQQDELAEQRRQQEERDRREADAKAQKEADEKRKEIAAKLAADIEAAKPERERIVAHVRACIEGLPETRTVIGNHMAQDVRDALVCLLNGWLAEERKAA